jgi:heme exporter protein C
MGELQRIMYIHVPCAWNGLLAITFAFVCAIVFLFKGDFRWDSRMEASIEVGVVFGVLLCIQGSIWAKPTWGVWWDWDPSLTTTAVLIFAYRGILALRKFVDDPVKRAIWSSVATIIAFVDAHRLLRCGGGTRCTSSIDDQYRLVAILASLRLNAFGILFLMIAFIMIRSRIASYRLRNEMAVRASLEKKQESSHEPGSRRRRMGIRLGRVWHHHAGPPGLRSEPHHQTS